MIVTKQEYKAMFKEIDGMSFSPMVNLIEEETEVDGEKIKVFKYEILKTTDEVYKEYLNPPKPQPTKEEILQKQLLETQNMLLKMQEQILLNNK